MMQLHNIPLRKQTFKYTTNNPPKLVTYPPTHKPLPLPRPLSYTSQPTLSAIPPTRAPWSPALSYSNSVAQLVVPGAAYVPAQSSPADPVGLAQALQGGYTPLRADPSRSSFVRVPSWWDFSPLERDQDPLRGLLHVLHVSFGCWMSQMTCSSLSPFVAWRYGRRRKVCVKY